MFKSFRSSFSPVALSLAVLVSCMSAGAQTPFFAPNNVVVLVEGCGTLVTANCAYTDNQGTPMTLFQYQPTGTTSLNYVNALTLTQTGSGANLPVSSEYGSSSEGTLSLSGGGQYLTLMGYGINAATYNANPAAYGTLAAKPTALAQSGSLTGQGYTPVARVVALIDANGNVNSASALYNIFNLNNPRSVYTADGLNAYVSGQGSGSDATGGVFYTPLFVTNNTPTPITGLDTTGFTVAQDTRAVQIYNNKLWVSVDSKGGSNNARSFLGTLGMPPATSLYMPAGAASPGGGAGPTQWTSSTNANTTQLSNTSKVTLTATETNGINSTGQQINLSASGFFFANASTVYVADTGNPKQNSATSLLGDGGLQKWVNTAADGSGTWQLQWTLAAGLNLVQNPSAQPANTAGTTGLYSVVGVVSGATVNLYVVNSTIGDTDQTYIYGVTDVVASTIKPVGSFTLLATAPVDSNFKGISVTPAYPAGSATLTTVPSGLTISTAGTGCAPGTYVAPITLAWTPGAVCTLTTTTPQSSNGTSYGFSQWQDGTSHLSDSVIAPTNSATYTATFTPITTPTVTAASSTIVYGTATTTLSASVAYSGSMVPAGGLTFTVNGSSIGVGAVSCTGTASPVTCTASYQSAALANGSYAVVATESASNTMNAASGTGTLTVGAATDFSFTTLGVGYKTVARGGTATFTFTLAPNAASYPAAVNFNVSFLPPGATYTFSPTTVGITGGAQTVTLTVVTSATMAANRLPAVGPLALWEKTSAALLLMGLVPLYRRRRMGLLRNLMLALVCCGGLLAFTSMTGCSSPAAATVVPVDYNVTVTATSGSVQHSAVATLTVK